MTQKETNRIEMKQVISFVGVTFDQHCKKGEYELNEKISQGYRIVTDYQTSSGVVFSLTKNLDNEVIDPKQKLMDDYCVGITAGVSQ
jgi:hypothetical protein